MKYVSEYRDEGIIERYIAAIADLITQPWTLMEICGGQTHTIVKHGLDQLLPAEVTLIHGPGCPVCVTDTAIIDQALVLAAQPDVIFCSYGDMLRVPGTETDLLSIKAQGGDVRMVYSPLDAIALAQANPNQQVVFFAVGFETTAPATAMAVHQAHQQRLDNFSVLLAHVLVPPAMETILASPHCQVQGFLAAGHVCSITGYEGYRAIAQKYRIPIVVTGFEPVDILQGIYLCLQQLETGRTEVENQYARAVAAQGNQSAQRLISQFFRVAPRTWRGLGNIEQSGLCLQDAYRYMDAQRRFSDQLQPHNGVILADADCISGLVLQGKCKPHDCVAFGNRCRPEHPLGAPMVSSEGACAAYYRYRLAS
ncbi:hydrogenase expression/formation protein HypD [Synechococcus sp. PCC 7335]|uniref:hydrogenase formation protein HypD n=1 Tax=Synechococcus sp. (strain ATCC 29403 / PCC 7335) TaxID=91464 RepID=UPI00017EDD67|nr:hydrogenase formation protein HypD [Synechococcus sp. PCC 7335]EDX83621.1 hydrogenase expression/formation protein HypD [Synechococcus sp. PCC 7335]